MNCTLCYNICEEGIRCMSGVHCATEFPYVFIVSQLSNACSQTPMGAESIRAKEGEEVITFVWAHRFWQHPSCSLTTYPTFVGTTSFWGTLLEGLKASGLLVGRRRLCLFNATMHVESLHNTTHNTSRHSFPPLTTRFLPLKNENWMMWGSA